jgi:hypothetical protein
MVFKFTTAFTVPINPAGATPVLSHAQVWKALKIKAERPQRFVPAIVDCEVVSRHETGLLRKVAFKPGVGPADGAIEEEVEYVGDMRVRTFSIRPSRFECTK